MNTMINEAGARVPAGGSREIYIGTSEVASFVHLLLGFAYVTSIALCPPYNRDGCCDGEKAFGV